MATRVRIILAVALTFCGLASGGSIASAPALVETRSVYLAPGIGIEGIAVGYSTRSSVIAKYGDDFSLFTHGVYSYEMRYWDHGLSFWYRYSDPAQKIFTISVERPCHCFTSRGIVVGRSTLKDVFKAYGETELSTSTALDFWWAEYPGIAFLIEQKPKDDVIKDREKMMKRKVVEIEILQFESRAREDGDSAQRLKRRRANSRAWNNFS